MNAPPSRHQTWGRGRFDGTFSTPHSPRDDMKCVHSWCTERVWGKVGKELGKVGKSWEKWLTVGKSGQKLEKVVKSEEKWEKVGKKWGKVVKSSEK